MIITPHPAPTIVILKIFLIEQSLEIETVAVLHRFDIENASLIHSSPKRTIAVYK